MDPEPLIRIATDEVLDDFREELSVRGDIGLLVAGADEGQRGIKTKFVFSEARVPDGETGDDGCVGAERDAGQTTRGAGWDPEVIHENSLWRGHVGVHEEANDFTLFHAAQQAAGWIVLVDSLIAVQGAVFAHHPVKVRVVE